MAAKIDETVRIDAANAVLCWLATVDPEGTPNVTPKQIFAVFDDEHFVVADIASANSVRNIVAHPRVCLSFVDVFRLRGFKVTGTGTIHARGGGEFDVFAAPLLAMVDAAFVIRHVIVVRVERLTRIKAPSYTVFPARTEAERMRIAYATYGVRPIHAVLADDGNQAPSTGTKAL